MAEANWRQNLQGCALVLPPSLLPPPPLPRCMASTRLTPSSHVVCNSPLGVGSHRRLAEPALGAVALCPLLPGPLGRHPPPLKRTLKRGRGARPHALSLSLCLSLESLTRTRPSAHVQLLCPVEVGTVPRLPPVHRRRRSVLCRLVLHRPPHARHQASQICRASIGPASRLVRLPDSTDPRVLGSPRSPSHSAACACSPASRDSLRLFELH